MTPVDSFQTLSIAVTSLSKQASIQTIIQIMNILNVFVLFVILLKCVAASGDIWELGSGRQLREEFEWLKENWGAGRIVGIYSTM